MIGEYRGKSPVIGKNVFVAESAAVIGDTEVGDCSSVWHQAAIRGDVWRIRIGSYTNIQDCCVLHVTTGGPDLAIGNYVTVGHGAILHSCTIEDACLIGMGATILDGAKIGTGSIVAAGSVVLENTVVPPHSLVAGVPAAVKKELGEKSKDQLIKQAVHYHEVAMDYLKLGTSGKGAHER
ncbi:MAG: hypothetical protein B6D63_01030 [Candidatus Latescibacteria bacterium 4484_7]|nr:MAG: hypothetical protein B6D63_01030 [Candidatus Latescibacteria bacterium 4484_7]RKZ07979.1 MAG: gamma carbonic anhydrase family protein [bacterium]